MTAETCSQCGAILAPSGTCGIVSCANYKPVLFDEDLAVIQATCWRNWDSGDDEDDDDDELALALAAEMVASMRRIEALLETLVIKQIKDQATQ